MGRGTNGGTGDGETIELTGRVARIRFCNPDNGFTVAELEAGEDTATIQGYFVDLSEGQTVTVAGRWVEHRRYGRQFEVRRYERVVPATVPGVIAYLQSGIIKGVGPKTAAKIVDAFGGDALRVIEQSPGRLAEIRGIGRRKAGEIAAAIEAHREMERVLVYLFDRGIGPGLAARIYRRYGSDAVRVLEENPYRLTDELFGVGFHTADRIARAGGVAAGSPFRLQAAVRHVLVQAAASRGHVFLPGDELLQAVLSLLNGDVRPAEQVPLEDVRDAVLSLVREQRAYIEDDDVYPAHLYEAERATARHLARLDRNARSLTVLEGQLERLIAAVESEAGLRYASEQRQAIAQALSSGVTIVTGGPGTGKTTVVRGIIAAVRQARRDARILLAAPTGRAARRLSEATGSRASTIHRLLGFRPGPFGWQFEYDADSSLQADLVVVDEFSMVDIELARSLVQALADGTRLLIVGDADQLPSVGPGNVLRDLIGSGFLPTVTLRRIFRQGEGSAIVLGAHRILQGQDPVPRNKERGAEDHDLTFVPVRDPERVAAYIVEAGRRLVAAGYSARDIQVLAPMYRGAAGVDALNAGLQEVLNPVRPGCRHLRLGSRTFRDGDKVMQLYNNYERGVFNGDIGMIVDIQDRGAADDGRSGAPDGGAGSEGGEPGVAVDFDGRRTVYARSDLDELAHAYAITVHKSQGNEFPVVLLPVVTQHYVMLRRNLIYTAISRARSRMVMVGSRRALSIGVRNDQVQRRYTRLQARLEQAFEGRL